jgi:hypothetical protein
MSNFRAGYIVGQTEQSSRPEVILKKKLKLKTVWIQGNMLEDTSLVTRDTNCCGGDCITSVFENMCLPILLNEINRFS